MSRLSSSPNVQVKSRLCLVNQFNCLLLKCLSEITEATKMNLSRNRRWVRRMPWGPTDTKCECRAERWQPRGMSVSPSRWPRTWRSRRRHNRCSRSSRSRSGWAAFARSERCVQWPARRVQGTSRSPSRSRRIPAPSCPAPRSSSPSRR